MENWTLRGGSDLLRGTGGIVVWRRRIEGEKTDGHRNAGYDDDDGGGDDGDGKIRGGCCAFM